MARGRSGVWEAVARLYYRGQGGSVVIVERGGASGLRRISLEEVTELRRGFLLLRDGTVVPLHRIVYVEDGEGRRVYSRLRGREQEG